MEERRQRLEGWEAAVTNMESFNIPEGFKSASEKNKYPRFTGYLKEWAFNILKETGNGNRTFKMSHERPEDETWLFLANFPFDVTENNKDKWWKNAMDIGRGAKVKNELSAIPAPTETAKEAAYGLFMPAYRAIKEKFDQRSVFQWIFNHAQYVAERDSLRALSAIMTTLTGETKEQLEKRYQNDRKVMPTSDKAELERFIENGANVEEKTVSKEVVKEKLTVKDAEEKEADRTFDFDTDLQKATNRLLDDSFDL